MPMTFLFALGLVPCAVFAWFLDRARFRVAAGDPVRGLKWFKELLAAGLQPNKISFNSLIDAYMKVTALWWLLSRATSVSAAS